MIELFTNRIIDWLIRYDAIKEEDRDIYAYAVYSICLSCSPLFLAIIIGEISGNIKQSMLIIIPFVCIRKFSGGYHAKRAGTCLISSSLVLLSCIGLSFYIKCGWTLGVITVLAAASLIYFSPIDSENRRLEQEEKKYCKKSIIRIILFFLILELLMLLCDSCTFVVCISIGIVLSAALQLPCILKKSYQRNQTSVKKVV